jgi:hypothetical protein
VHAYQRLAACVGHTDASTRDITTEAEALLETALQGVRDASAPHKLFSKSITDDDDELGDACLEGTDFLVVKFSSVTPEKVETLLDGSPALQRAVTAAAPSPRSPHAVVASLAPLVTVQHVTGSGVVGGGVCVSKPEAWAKLCAPPAADPHLVKRGGVDAVLALQQDTRTIFARVGSWNLRAVSNALGHGLPGCLPHKAAYVRSLITSQGWTAVALQEAPPDTLEQPPAAGDPAAPRKSFIDRFVECLQLDTLPGAWACVGQTLPLADGAGTEHALVLYNATVWELNNVYTLQTAPFKRRPLVAVLQARGGAGTGSPEVVGGGGDGGTTAIADHHPGGRRVLALVSVHLASFDATAPQASLAATRAEAAALGPAAAAVAGRAPAGAAVLVLGDFNLAPPGSSLDPTTAAGDAWVPLLRAGYEPALGRAEPTNEADLCISRPAAAGKEYDNAWLGGGSGGGDSGAPAWVDPVPIGTALPLLALELEEFAAVHGAMEAALRGLPHQPPTALVADFMADTRARFADFARKRASDHRPISVVLHLAAATAAGDATPSGAASAPSGAA